MKRHILLIALIAAFEGFNYNTTQFALQSVGAKPFIWSVILAIGFCLVDLLGVYRLFVNDIRRDLQKIWLLMSFWFFGITVNAIFTWWFWFLAINQLPGIGNEILSRQESAFIVPIILAVFFWVVRITLIGTLNYNDERLSQPDYQDHPIVPVKGTKIIRARVPAPDDVRQN